MYRDPSGDERIQNAFTAAAFLANDVWMMHPTPTTPTPYVDLAYVAFDLGKDTQVPVMGLAGMIIVPVLLALDLACLLGLALYSARMPRWTVLLDSFAMMRIGASIADRLPLLVAPEASQIKVLDETPGWIGDADGKQADGKAREDSQFRELGLGAEAPLQTEDWYRSY